MAIFAKLCEHALAAIDDRGAAGCYGNLVHAFAKKYDMPIEGLWAAINAHLQGTPTDKLVKRMMQAYGGRWEYWMLWRGHIIRQPDCPKDP